MARRLTTGIFWLHRWLGAVFGLLMLLWCLSGFVMVFVPYPQFADRGGEGSYRPAYLPPLLAADLVLPESLDYTEPMRQVELEMLGSMPVLFVRGESGRAATYDLHTGRRIVGIDAGQAQAVARAYATQTGGAASSAAPEAIQRDQWTVSGSFDEDRPLWRVALGDTAGTVLHISSSTGRIVQKTTRVQRFWNWLGAVPHWLYFTELRHNVPLWVNTVIYTSLAGSFLTLLGFYIGVRQLWHARRGRRYSPYRGFLWWHHLPALVFGLFALTWVVSGLFSMQPWGWFEGGNSAVAGAQLQRGMFEWTELRNSLSAVTARLPSGTVRLMLVQRSGPPAWIAEQSGRRRQRLDAAGAAAPMVQDEADAAARVLGGQSADLLHVEDDYYYSGPDSSVVRLPVWRVVAGNDDRTLYYLDAVSGELTLALDLPTRAFRWWHLGLHRFDFSSWLRARPLHEILLVFLLAGATLVCATGAWLGVRRLIGRPLRG